MGLKNATVTQEGRNFRLLWQELTFWHSIILLKFIYSEKVTKFCETFTLLLSYGVPVKSKVKISQNFVAFSGYMNFNSTALQNFRRTYFTFNLGTWTVKFAVHLLLPNSFRLNGLQQPRDKNRKTENELATVPWIA